jgi:hypothetical protein
MLMELPFGYLIIGFVLGFSVRAAISQFHRMQARRRHNLSQ